MRLISEKELKRSILLSDLFGGIAAAVFTGSFMGVSLYFFLGIGVGG